MRRDRDEFPLMIRSESEEVMVSYNDTTIGKSGGQSSE
jgi:hypothetical protein